MVAIETAAPLAVAEPAWAARFLKAIGADAPFYATIAVFTTISAVIAAALHRDYLLAVILECVGVWSVLALSFCALAGAARLTVRLSLDRPADPWSVVWDTVEPLLAPEVAAGALLVATFAVFMGAFTTLKTLLPLINPFWADPLFANLDRAMLLGRDGWSVLQPVLGHHWVTRAVEGLYGPGWMAMTTFLPAYFCLFAKDRGLRRRFLSAFLMAWIVSGALLACVFMSAGPAFYGAITGHARRFDGLVRYLRFDLASPLSAAAEQGDLWTIYQSHAPGLAAGISAVPSMHVTMTLLCALAASRLDWRLGVAAWIMMGLIVVGSIHLGWHYVSGDLGAIAVTALIYWPLAGWLADRRASAS